jgi:thiosulfate reductase cytochrome b subunit
MTESAESCVLPVQKSGVLDGPRHPFFVRVTHWIFSLSFLALVLSGVAILLAHPRLYWGETGAVGAPSLFDLPLPFVREIPIRGPGRYLHYLSAWICVFTGFVYFLAGVFTRHFQEKLLPARAQLSWPSIAQVIANHVRLKRPTEDARSYNVLQRLSYLLVVFLLVPLMIWTGLAMSPALVSVVPWLVRAFGGQQSARTIHFFVAVCLVGFLLVHLWMVWLAGFKLRMRAMIVGASAAGQDRQ